MWNTIRRIKKIIFKTLYDVVSGKQIDLSDLTYGLKWKNVKCIIGNNRLRTDNNDVYLFNNHNVSNNSIITTDIKNRKYNTKIINGRLFEMQSNGWTESSFISHKIKTIGDVRIIMGFCFGAIAQDSGGVDINVEIGFSQNDNIIFTKSSDWNCTTSYATGSGGEAGEHTDIVFQCMDIVIKNRLYETESGLGISIPSFSMHGDLRADSSYYMIIYDDYDSPIDSNSDLHMIAWEED